MPLPPIERWSPDVLAQAQVDARTYPTESRDAMTAAIGGQRARRVLLLRQRDAPVPAPQRPTVSDDDLVVTRWDRPAAPTSSAPGERFHRVTLPEDEAAEEPIEDLLGRREAEYDRTKARAATLGPRQLRMPPGPYAIAHLGDPHLDDPGCDIRELRRVIRTVSATPGMYAGNGGDTTNNWVGRLAELYAHQGTTEEEGVRLSRWLLRSLSWAYVCLGNHDLWTKGARTLRLLAEAEDATIGVMAPDDIRLEFVSPGGVTVRLHVRHDHGGHSMWNDAHALKRTAALGDWPADVYAGFHRHVAVSHQEEFGGRMRTYLRARGFKRFDAYARAKGFVEQQHGSSITTIVDPAAGPADRVRVRWDIEEAAEELTWLRRRRAA